MREASSHPFSIVCHDVEVEPHLQTLTGGALISGANPSGEARLDVSARGLGH